ncbi:hypothetical protein MBLNU230_g3447t1, partial [Neophaeotheca triangularis]
MSLKQEIETWVAALAAYDNNEFDNALKCFDTISDTSKILFNTGVIHATLGEHAKAVDCYQRAVQLDQYLAVAYFQQGVSNFLMGDFEEALANFNDTLLYLRGNNNIDYEQLGLKFKLFSCEVLFNRGLCYIYLQQKDAGIQDLMFAAKEKMVPDHDVIDEAIREQAEGYTVFSIPVGVVYRPNEAKVKNLQTKDYLGKARLVAAQDQQRTNPRRQAALAAQAVDDRPNEKLSYAALNLVRPGLTSRSRQQSEPPMQRNVFPPTPPPEPEGLDSKQAKRRSTDSARSASSGFKDSRPAAKPLTLNLGAAAFDQTRKPEKPRLGTQRSASERPPVRTELQRDLSKSSSNSRRKLEHAERRSFRELPSVRVEDDPIEAYSAQVSSPPRITNRPPIAHRRSKSSAHSLQHPTLHEEDETDHNSSSSYDSRYDSPLAFEIIPPRPKTSANDNGNTNNNTTTTTNINNSKNNPHLHPRPRSRARHPHPSPPPPQLRTLRIKVHAPDDNRYVMTHPDVRYEALAQQIRAKFGFRGGGLKLKIRDEEGDMVTLSDQEDLDMAVGVCAVGAAGEGGRMGKMEVWVQE